MSQNPVNPNSERVPDKEPQGKGTEKTVEKKAPSSKAVQDLTVNFKKYLIDKIGKKDFEVISKDNVAKHFLDFVKAFFESGDKSGVAIEQMMEILFPGKKLNEIKLDDVKGMSINGLSFLDYFSESLGADKEFFTVLELTVKKEIDNRAVDSFVKLLKKNGISEDKIDSIIKEFDGFSAQNKSMLKTDDLLNLTQGNNIAKFHDLLVKNYGITDEQFDSIIDNLQSVFDVDIVLSKVIDKLMSKEVQGKFNRGIDFKRLKKAKDKELILLKELLKAKFYDHHRKYTIWQNSMQGLEKFRLNKIDSIQKGIFSPQVIFDDVINEFFDRLKKFKEGKDYPQKQTDSELFKDLAFVDENGYRGLVNPDSGYEVFKQFLKTKGSVKGINYYELLKSFDSTEQDVQDEKFIKIILNVFKNKIVSQPIRDKIKSIFEGIIDSQTFNKFIDGLSYPKSKISFRDFKGETKVLEVDTIITIGKNPELGTHNFLALQDTEIKLGFQIDPAKLPWKKEYELELLGKQYYKGQQVKLNMKDGSSQEVVLQGITENSLNFVRLNDDSDSPEAVSLDNIQDIDLVKAGVKYGFEHFLMKYISAVRYHTSLKETMQEGVEEKDIPNIESIRKMDSMLVAPETIVEKKVTDDKQKSTKQVKQEIESDSSVKSKSEEGESESKKKWDSINSAYSELQGWGGDKFQAGLCLFFHIGASQSWGDNLPFKMGHTYVRLLVKDVKPNGKVKLLFTSSEASDDAGKEIEWNFLDDNFFERDGEGYNFVFFDAIKKEFGNDIIKMDQAILNKKAFSDFMKVNKVEDVFKKFPDGWKNKNMSDIQYIGRTAELEEVKEKGGLKTNRYGIFFKVDFNDGNVFLDGSDCGVNFKKSMTYDEFLVFVADKGLNSFNEDEYKEASSYVDKTDSWKNVLPNVMKQWKGDVASIGDDFKEIGKDLKESGMNPFKLFGAALNAPFKAAGAGLKLTPFSTFKLFFRGSINIGAFISAPKMIGDALKFKLEQKDNLKSAELYEKMAKGIGVLGGWVPFVGEHFQDLAAEASGKAGGERKKLIKGYRDRYENEFDHDHMRSIAIRNEILCSDQKALAMFKKNPQRALGAFMYSFSRDGMYFRKTAEAMGTGRWVLALLGPVYYEQFKKEYHEAYLAAKNSDSENVRMALLEKEYRFIFSNISTYQNTLYYNGIGPEIEGLSMNLTDKIADNASMSSKKNDFNEIFKGPYSSFRSNGRYFGWAGNLQSLLERAEEDEDYPRSMACVILPAITGGMHFGNINKILREHLKKICRMSGFDILLHGLTHSMEGVKDIIGFFDDVTKMSGIDTAGFIKATGWDYKKLFGEGEEFHKNAISFSKKFFAWWDKNQNGKKLMDVINMNQFNTAQGPKTLFDLADKSTHIQWYLNSSKLFEDRFDTTMYHKSFSLPAVSALVSPQVWHWGTPTFHAISSLRGSSFHGHDRYLDPGSFWGYLERAFRDKIKEYPKMSDGGKKHFKTFLYRRLKNWFLHSSTYEIMNEHLFNTLFNKYFEGHEKSPEDIKAFNYRMERSFERDLERGKKFLDQENGILYDESGKEVSFVDTMERVVQPDNDENPPQELMDGLVQLENLLKTVSGYQQKSIAFDKLQSLRQTTKKPSGNKQEKAKVQKQSGESAPDFDFGQVA